MTEIIGTYDTTGSPALSVEQDIALLHHRLSTVQREHTEDRNRLEGTRAIARTAIRRIDELEGRVTVMAELLPGTPPANDELWRLARDMVFAAGGQETALRYEALDIYVREHTP